MGGLIKYSCARVRISFEYFARICESMAAGLNLSLILLTVEPPNADTDSSDSGGYTSTEREELDGKYYIIWKAG